MNFNRDKIELDYTNLSKTRNIMMDDLKKIVLDSKTPLEGNSFYIHGTLNLYPELYTKQLNLFWCGQQAKTKLCEIGFNAGHSLMLILIGKDDIPIDVTIFDIGHHAYTKPCIKYIQSKYPHNNFEYVEGDSTITMPLWINKNKKCIGLYDVIHVDGGHSEHCILNDMKNSDILLKIGGILIIDDTNLTHIGNVVESYIMSGQYQELNVYETFGYPHKILLKNNIDKTDKISGNTYIWNDNEITFLNNGIMIAFGKGIYRQINNNIYEATFGGCTHIITFNGDHTEYTSVRCCDNEVVKGKII